MEMISTGLRHHTKSLQRLNRFARRRIRFDFQADFSRPNRAVTNRARRSSYHRSSEYAGWLGYGDFADPHCLAGLLSQSLFVRHIDTWGGKPRSIPEVSGGENRLDGSIIHEQGNRSASIVRTDLHRLKDETGEWEVIRRRLSPRLREKPCAFVCGRLVSQGSPICGYGVLTSVSA
jgi:hypothetical protein